MPESLPLYQVVQYLMTLKPHAKVYLYVDDVGIVPLEKEHILIVRDEDPAEDSIVIKRTHANIMQ